MTSTDDVDDPDGSRWTARCFLLLLLRRLNIHSRVCLSARATPCTHACSLQSTTCADLQIVNRVTAPPSDRRPLPSRASALLAPMTDLTPEQQADIGTTTRRVEHTCSRRQPLTVTHG